MVQISNYVLDVQQSVLSTADKAWEATEDKDDVEALPISPHPQGPHHLLT
jgi:hypothetical protein